MPDILTVDLTKLYADASNGYLNGRRFRDDTVNLSIPDHPQQPRLYENVPEDNGAIITDGLEGSLGPVPLHRPAEQPAVRAESLTLAGLTRSPYPRCGEGQG